MGEGDSPISGCPPNQRSGLAFAPPFFVPCGCWDDMIIPIGLVTNTLRGLLNRGLKEGAEKVLGKTLLKNRLGKLAAKKLAANRAIEVVERIGKIIYDEINRLENLWSIEEELKLKKISRLSSLTGYIDSINNTIRYLREEIIRIQREYPGWVTKIRELEQQFPGETYYPGWHLTTYEYFREYGVEKPLHHTLRSRAFPNYYLYLDWAARAKQDILDKRKAIKDALQILSETQTRDALEITLLKEGIKAHEKVQKTIIAKLEQSRPSFSIGPGRIVPEGTYDDQLDYLHTQMKELEDHISTIDTMEKRANVVVDSRVEEINKQIDLTFPDIALTMGEVIVDILSTFSIVGPHLCREGSDGVTLNEENCKCDICPPDKELCRPITFDPGIRLPWTAIADSANYCLDPCCEGKLDSEGYPLRIYKGRVFSGGITELMGVPQCTCECPSDGLGQPKMRRPCKTSECDDESTCASIKYPDDDCTTLRLFTKFYWYDGSDPTKPWCAFRCKEEMSDADCFSTYGEFAKWDTRNAYCSCICKEKSETDCPEKATYTMVDSYHNDPDKSYCDELASPTEPVCTCVCDRPDDCPPGEVLNRSITGPNACECVPDGSPDDNYPMGAIGAKTYYFDNKIQSWVLSQDS